MKKINQELIALFDKYGSDRRRALRENKKLSYLYALADLRENLLDWCQFEPEQQALPLLQVYQFHPLLLQMALLDSLTALQQDLLALSWRKC